MDRYLIAARSAAAQGAWSEADPYYRKVLEDFPDHAPVVYELAKVAGVYVSPKLSQELTIRLNDILMGADQVQGDDKAGEIKATTSVARA